MKEQDPKGPTEEWDPDRILKEMEEEASAARLDRTGETPAGEGGVREGTQCLGFYLGSEIYGFPLRKLREVAPLTRITPVPGSPPKVAGLVNLRGQIVCALQAGACLGLPEASSAETPFLLVLEGFEEPLGLVVDSIADIYSVEPDQIQPPLASWPEERARFFLGTVRVKEGLLGLLDLEKMIAS